ncbi:MAG: YCF48-related protein [Spirochaetes bacterium]|nr:YCF48-related protein [Spirochaetota bacterium]
MTIVFSTAAALENEPDFQMSDFRDLFYDITYLNEKKAVIVGMRGRILVSHEKYNNLWRTSASNTKESLTCLSFVDEQYGWAAGHGGIIIHTSDGAKTWEIQRKASTNNLFILDIQFVNRQAGFACGAYGTLLKTVDGGKTWENIATGSDIIYNGLYFSDSKRGFIAGEFGTLLRTTDGGTTWEKINTGSKYTFFGVHPLSSTGMIVFGISGRVLISRDMGLSWKPVKTDTKTSIYKAATRGDEIVLVGRMGLILQSGDGGKNFTVKTEDELTSFSGVSPHPEGGFICVGEMGKIYRIQSLK